ncbi:hypothetical protein ACJX0J_019170, partial [Zea mays]
NKLSNLFFDIFLFHNLNGTFVCKIWVLVKKYVWNTYQKIIMWYEFVGLGHHWDDEETHAAMRAPLSSTSHMVHQRELLVQSVAATVVAGMIVVVIGQLVVGGTSFSKQQIRYR